jgi:drug/metabolite transporter (DMT)-like permease
MQAMDVFVLIVILGSALLHATWNVVVKGGSDKLFEAVMKTHGGGVWALAAFAFLPLPDAACLPYLLGSAGIHFFYYLFLAYAYRGADMSYAYTLMRGASPLLTAVVTTLAVESLSPGGWTGVLLLSAGILVLTGESARRHAFRLAPTLFALGNAVVIMGYTVVDGTGVRLSGHALSYVCGVFALNALPIFLFALVRRGGEYFRYAGQRWPWGLFGGTCSLAAYGLSLWAMSRAPIALVASLRETSVLFGMLLAVFVLKERFTTARLAAVILVAAGLISMRILA